MAEHVGGYATSGPACWTTRSGWRRFVSFVNAPDTPGPEHHASSANGASRGPPCRWRLVPMTAGRDDATDRRGWPRARSTRMPARTRRRGAGRRASRCALFRTYDGHAVRARTTWTRSAVRTCSPAASSAPAATCRRSHPRCTSRHSTCAPASAWTRTPRQPLPTHPVRVRRTAEVEVRACGTEPAIGAAGRLHRRHHRGPAPRGARGGAGAARRQGRVRARRSASSRSPTTPTAGRHRALPGRAARHRRRHHRDRLPRLDGGGRRLGPGRRRCSSASTRPRCWPAGPRRAGPCGRPGCARRGRRSPSRAARCSSTCCASRPDRPARRGATARRAAARSRRNPSRRPAPT